MSQFSFLSAFISALYCIVLSHDVYRWNNSKCYALCSIRLFNDRYSTGVCYIYDTRQITSNYQQASFLFYFFFNILAEGIQKYSQPPAYIVHRIFNCLKIECYNLITRMCIFLTINVAIVFLYIFFLLLLHWQMFPGPFQYTSSMYV